MQPLAYILGAIAYAVIYGAVLGIALLLSNERKYAAVVITILFAIPLALGGVAAGYEWTARWWQDRDFESACAAAAAEEHIARAFDGVEGFAVETSKGQFLPGDFAELRRPARWLSRGYEYVQLGSERFVEDGDDYAISVAAKDDARFRVSIAEAQTNLSQSGWSGVGSTVVMTVKDGTYGPIATKKWVRKKESGKFCPSKPVDGARDGSGSGDFLVRVLKPKARAETSSVPIRRELVPEISALTGFPARLPSERVKSAMRQVLGCGDGVELVDPFAQPLAMADIGIYRGLRIRHGEVTRTLYSRRYRPDHAFCREEAIYVLAGSFGDADALSLLRLDPSARPTHIYALRLKGAGYSALSLERSAPQIFDVVADRAAIQFTRVHFYLPLNLGEPSVRVRGAYRVRIPICEDPGVLAGRCWGKDK